MITESQSVEKNLLRSTVAGLGLGLNRQKRNISLFARGSFQCTPYPPARLSLISDVFGPDATLLDWLLPITGRRFASEQARVRDRGFWCVPARDK